MKDVVTYAEYLNLLWGAIVILGGKFITSIISDIKELKENLKETNLNLENNKLHLVKEFATGNELKELEKAVSELRHLVTSVDTRVSGNYINKEDFKSTVEYLMKLVDKVESKTGGHNVKV